MVALMVVAATLGMSLAQAPDVSLQTEKAAPFSWFLQPSDVVGFKDCPEGFQLTPACVWNSGMATFQLFAGERPVPIRQRVRTLATDMPEITWTFDHEGVRYRVSTFGTTLGLDPRELLVAMVQVQATNLTRYDKTAELSSHMEPLADGAGFRMPIEDWYYAKFCNLDKQTFPIGLGAVEDHVLYSSREAGANWGQNKAFELKLGPNQTQTLEFKVPLVPLAKVHGARLAAFEGLDYSTARAATAKSWKAVFDRAMQIDLPEAKPVRTYRASLEYLLIARDAQQDPNRYVQKVNEFQYDHFYARDTAFIARTYDMVGLHQIARQVLESYLVRDRQGKVEGLLRTMPDDWGQSVWALAAHIRATGNLGLAKEIYPALPNHLKQFKEAIATDPLKLWPVAGAYDNEVINGHYTAHNFWALLALQEAENLAKLVGKNEDAKEFKRFHDEYRARFLKRLRWIVDQTGGYIPPGIDKPLEGHDWENASGGVYPFRVFPVDHPYVRKTIDLVRATKYREGIMTWGPNAFNLQKQIEAGIEDPDPLFLHHYQTFHVMQTMLAQGRQRDVVEDLYSVLAHTSSTHTGFETSVRPWADRDTGGNMPPHGWFAARYVEMLRNMLVREDGSDLHLLSVVSPTWVRVGRPLAVRRAATDFGKLDFTLTSSDQGAVLSLDTAWKTPPKRLIVHWPWFVRPISAKADGKILSISGGMTVLPVTAKSVDLRWQRVPTPKLDYNTAVDLFLQKNYNPKPGEDRMYLFPRPTMPRIVNGVRMFVGKTQIRLAEPTGKGVIRYTTNGTDPTPKSKLYGSPIAVDRDTEIRAASFWPDGRVSPILKANLTKTQPIKAAWQEVTRPGLLLQVYKGAFEKLPDFANTEAASRAFVRVVGLDIPDLPQDEFALRFTGAFYADESKVYTFALGSDDGSRLEVAGQKVIDNDGLHAYRELRGQIALQKGWHPVAVSFFDAGSVEYLRLFLVDDQGKKTTIPAQRFGIPTP